MCDCVNVQIYWGWSRKPKARKAHECVECKREIKPGNYYFAYAGVTSAGFWSAKVCLECEGDWGAILDACYEIPHLEVCKCYGELAEVISQAIDGGFLEPDDPLAVKWFGTPEEQHRTWCYQDPRQVLLPYEQELRP